MPDGVLGVRAVAVSLRPAGPRFSVGSPFPLAGFRISKTRRRFSGGPTKTNTQPLLSERKLAPALFPVCARLWPFCRRPSFFCGSPASLAAVHRTAALCAGSGIALPAKKMRRPAAGKTIFFARRGVDKRYTRSYNDHVADTHKPTDFAHHRCYNSNKRGVRNLAFYSQTAKALVGIRHEGLFFYPFGAIVDGYRDTG